MTAVLTRRYRARVVGFTATADGRVRAVQVRCPYCRGIHQHYWGTSDYAHPWCGTPGVCYQMLWPESGNHHHAEEFQMTPPTDPRTGAKTQ